MIVLTKDLESAVSYMVKSLLKPIRSALMRSIRAKIEWNVPIHNFEAVAPTSPSMRSRISRAALLVNVNANMRQGS